MVLSHIQSILSDIECHPFRFILKSHEEVHKERNGETHVRAGYVLQVVCEDTCAISGQPYTWKGRKWRISPHMTKSEIVQTAFLAAQTAQEHELRERFKYKGEPIFRPHYDVDALHKISKARTLDIRPSRDP